MKKLFNLIAMAVIMATATVTTSFAQATNTNAPVIQFEEMGHDFGIIAEGPQYTHSFKFKNVGKAPLIVTNVNTPCGCTTPNFTREPVMPGKTGEINVSYNSQGRIGVFNKTLSVQTNMGEGKDQALNIKGEVRVKEEVPVQEKKEEVKKSAPATKKAGNKKAAANKK
jgi:hypothetical protein